MGDVFFLFYYTLGCLVCYKTHTYSQVVVKMFMDGKFQFAPKEKEKLHVFLFAAVKGRRAPASPGYAISFSLSLDQVVKLDNALDRY